VALHSGSAIENGGYLALQVRGKQILPTLSG